MLIICAISGCKLNLRQRVIKPRLFSYLRQFAAVFGIPAGTLLYLTDHQAARNIRHPVGEL
jgi:hypothetical protein